ncbi:MAG: VanZ family protein [Candidatus Gracilibacteria bacterium]
MKKFFPFQIISAFLTLAYSALLVKVMVLKDVPMIKVGSIMLNFGGTQADRPANFLPFKTILHYVLGGNGLIIGGLNLIGNIALLVPIGFLVPLFYRKMTWKKALILAALSGLIIESMQVLLHVGIFDIDDVILNGLGVMVGYWISTLLLKWWSARNYKNIVTSGIIVVAVTFIIGLLVAMDLHQSQPTQNFRDTGGITSDRPNTVAGTSQNTDLCGGTGGNGEIISIGSNSVTLEMKEGRKQVINFTDKTVVNTSAGIASVNSLKTGVRVTLVGGPNADGSFTADALFVCDGVRLGTGSL